MLIDRNDYTNSELEEMGLSPDVWEDCFDEPDDEWVDEYDILVNALYHRDLV